MMTYTQGFRYIADLVTFEGRIRRSMASLVDDTTFLFLLHLYRNHVFDLWHVEVLSDPDIVEIVHGACNSEKYPEAKYYTKIVDYLQWFSLNENDTIFVRFLTGLSNVPFEWFDLYYSRLFDDLLKIYSESNRQLDFGILPEEIQELVFHLVNIRKGSKVYDPFAGLSSFGLGLPEGCTFVGQEIHKTTYALGILRLLAHGVQNFEIFNEDSFTHWRSRTYGDDVDVEKFDYIISFPPLGLKRASSEADLEYEWGSSRLSMSDYLLSNGANSSTAQGSIVACLFPESVLFEGGATGRQREQLISMGRINTVVSLPGGLLHVSGMKLCIIVFNSIDDWSDEIRFIDARAFSEKRGRKSVLLLDKLTSAAESKDASVVKFVPVRDVLEEGGDLLVGKYFVSDDSLKVPEGFEMVPLNDLLEVCRGTEKSLDECRLVRGRDLSSDGPIEPSTFSSLTPETVRNGKCRVIDRDSILVLKIGQLKPTLFHHSKDIDVTCNSNVIALCPLAEFYLPYIVSELRKEYVKRQFDALATGMMNSITVFGLLSIRILVPIDRSLQKSIFENELRLAEEQSSKVLALDEALENERKRIFELISIRRHRINPYFSGMRSDIIMLLDELETSGKLSADTEVSPGYTVKETLVNMQNCLSDVRKLFKELELEENVKASEAFDLNAFLKSYSFVHTVPDVMFTLKVDKPKIAGEAPLVIFNRDNLKEILDEIIHNAEKHFDKGARDGVVMLKAEYSSKSASLYVMNNGNPVPSDFDEDRSFTAGYHADADGTGMGLFRARQVCDSFGAKIEWANEPNSKYPVGLCITFKVKQ